MYEKKSYVTASLRVIFFRKYIQIIKILFYMNKKNLVLLLYYSFHGFTKLNYH